MKKSLTSFCKENKLSKTTVYRWLKEKGYDTSEGLDQDAVSAALSEFMPSMVIDSPGIEVGNHSTALALPDLNGHSYSLESFRDASVAAIEIDDPMAVVDQFIGHADRLIEGMSADIARRQQKLKQTKKAQEQASEKVDDLKAHAQQYRRKSREIAYLQSEQATELKESMELLQELGKPRGGNDPGTEA